MMERPTTHTIAASLCALLLFACADARAQEGERVPTTAGIAAIVNGESITSFELERETERQAVAHQRQGHSAELLADKRAEIRQQALESLIQDRLLLQRCDQEKIVVVDAEVEEAIKNRVQQLRKAGSSISSVRDFFRSFQDETGESEEEVREMIRKELRIYKLYRRIFKQAFVSPEELRACYEIQKHKYATDTRYVFRILIVPHTSPDWAAIVEEVKRRLADGVEFGALVKEFSRGPRAEEGGRFERTEQELRDFKEPIPSVVRSLEPGKNSEQVLTEDGLIFIRLEERAVGNPLSFEEAQNKIREEIVAARRHEQLLRYTAELRKAAHIRIFLESTVP